MVHDDRPASATSAGGPGWSSQTALGTITRWIESSRPDGPSPESRAAMDDLLPTGPDARDHVARFCALIVLSAAIASFGLLSDSGAVVIGAMLVAPLMTPIMALAWATVIADDARLVRAIALVALGTALAVAVGWVTSLVAGGTVIDVTDLPGEIRGRTFPGVLDLGVAISAGAAAGYIQPRRAAIAALPGVGIAVALVPPLATVGITFELGLSTAAGNALLLFLTNLAAIVFAAGLVLLASGFRPEREARRGTLGRRLTVTLLAVAIVAVPLVRHTRSVLADQRLESSVIASVQAWDADARVVDVVADVIDGEATVQLVVVGLGESEPAWQLAEEIRDRFGGPVQLRLLYQGDDLSVVSSR